MNRPYHSAAEKIETERRESLPPKTCTIDRLITRKEDIEHVLALRKTAVRRNGRYADPGEIMTLNGVAFEVYRVYRQAVADITDEDARMEGFADLESYKRYILSIHKGMSWIPSAQVWVHEFRPVHLQR